MNENRPLQDAVDLFEDAPCGYIVTRGDGSFVRANRTFLEWTGYSLDHLQSGKRFQDLLTIPSKIFYENQYFPLLTMQGFIREVAFNLADSQDRDLPVLVNSVQKADPRTGDTLVLSTLFGARDRRKYEQDLVRARQEAERLSTIVTMSADAIVRSSPDGLVETWNPGARRMFGVDESDARGQRIRAYLPSLSDADWTRIVGTLQSGESMTLETEGRHASARLLDVSAGFAPHFGPLGRLTGISAIIRDISESKAVQRLQYEFLAMTSHELRTPLTSIRGHAQLLRRQGRYTESMVQRIIDSSDQLGRLVDDLLLASSLEAGQFDLQPTDVDVKAVVQTSVDQLKGVSGRTIQVEMTPDVVHVWGDRLRLAQIFSNLLSNALKYSDPETEVVVRVSRSGTEAEVAVIDRGSGISADDLSRLFDRFYRASATADNAQGVGLGLYITNHLVHAHGGSLQVESEVDRGSVFTVALPLFGGQDSGTASRFDAARATDTLSNRN